MKKAISILAVLLVAVSIYLVSKNKKITIVNIHNMPTPTQIASPLSPIIPEEWQMHENTRDGYSIAHPIDWTVERSHVAPTQGGFTKYKGTKNNTNLSVLEIGFDSNNPQNLTLEEYGTRRLKSLGITPIKSGQVVLDNNLTVYKSIISIQGEVPANAEELYGIYYLFMNGNMVYWAEGYSNNYANDESFYDTMLSTVDF